MTKLRRLLEKRALRRVLRRNDRAFGLFNVPDDQSILFTPQGQVTIAQVKARLRELEGS